MPLNSTKEECEAIPFIKFIQSEGKTFTLKYDNQRLT
jgi:hypothetical protein